VLSRMQRAGQGSCKVRKKALVPNPAPIALGEGSRLCNRPPQRERGAAAAAG